MFSPLRACAFRIEKMMSCLRERARLSSPMDSACFTSSWMGLDLSSVRFIELRDCVSSAGLMISESSGADPCWAGCGPDCRDSLSQVAVQKCRKLGFGYGADLLRLDRAVLEENQRRDAADTELGRCLRVLVDVDLGDLDAIVVLAGDLIEDRGDHLARTTPLGPEVQQHRLGGLQDVLRKSGVRSMQNVRATHAVSTSVNAERKRSLGI